MSILLYCFHTAGAHICPKYNLLCPGISFYRRSKINIKRKPNYEIGWFHNWLMIISHRLDSWPFTLETIIFRYNYINIIIYKMPLKLSNHVLLVCLSISCNNAVKNWSLFFISMDYVWSKELSFSHKFWFSNRYIFATWWC